MTKAVSYKLYNKESYGLIYLNRTENKMLIPKK